MSWKFTDELSVTLQLSVNGAGEFGLYEYVIFRNVKFKIIYQKVG